MGKEVGRAARPVSREELSLPEPARTLWIRIRDPLKTALAPRAGPQPRMRLGGGTILAARWRHRKSRDIDVVTDPDFTLWRQSEGLNGVMRALGATACGYNARRRQYRATFRAGNESQSVEIWAHEPRPRGAERETDVDGSVELVLATSQILKGKLERGEDALARDLLDVITAEQQEPESLEVAVNAIEPPYVRLVMGVWEAAAEAIRARAEHELGEAGGADPRNLGPRASQAIRDRMYAGMRIEAREALIAITTTAADGAERTRTLSPAEARERFESEGLNAALAGMRQNPKEVRRAATAAAEAGRDEVVLQAGA